MGRPRGRLGRARARSRGRRGLRQRPGHAVPHREEDGVSSPRRCVRPHADVDGPAAAAPPGGRTGDGRPAALTALPRVRVPGASTTWSDMAVSQDGGTIAYASYRTASRKLAIDT